MGVGGDHRASHQGAHVRKPHHRRVCVGAATWCQNVSLFDYHVKSQFLDFLLKFNCFVSLPAYDLKFQLLTQNQHFLESISLSPQVSIPRFFTQIQLFFSEI